MNRIHTSAALLLLAVSPALAQTWTLSVPSTTPGVPAPRSWSGMAMEWSRNVSVMFGGYDSTTPTSPGSLGDTWNYDAGANTWTQLQPANAPLARDSHAMAYDIGRGVTVLFGGWDINSVELADTWEWNGTNWTNVTPSGPGPAARFGTSMVYDQARGTCILWGGSNYTLNVDYNDTWEWNGTAWSQITTSVAPPARSYQSMAHDPARNRTVMFGGWDAMGTPLGDTWEFNGTTWTRVTTPAAPAARLWSAMVYDFARSTIVLFGGSDYMIDFNDTWEFNGAWMQRATPSTPTARDSHAMVYDIAHNTTVMFAGYDMSTDLADTWEYTAPPTATYVTFGSGCPGSAGVPTLQPQNLPALGTTFHLDVGNLPAGGGVAWLVLGISNTQWNGLPLPLPLGSLGLQGCTAYCSADTGALLLHTNGTARWYLPLPSVPTLSGMQFYNQALSLDPLAANPLGVALSNAGHGTVR